MNWHLCKGFGCEHLKKKQESRLEDRNKVELQKIFFFLNSRTNRKS